jgi:hypothetical protein
MSPALSGALYCRLSSLRAMRVPACWKELTLRPRLLKALCRPAGKEASRIHMIKLTRLLFYFMEGRLLQVDTFTAKRYSLHWINWVRSRHTHTRKPAKDTAHKTILQNSFFLVFVCSFRSTQTWQHPHTSGIASCIPDLGSLQSPHLVQMGQTFRRG